MSTRTVSAQEAEKRLAELIGLAQQGDVVIARDDQARVKLVPIPQKANKRVFGEHRGKIRMREDFDAPLRDDFWLGTHPRSCCWIRTPLSGSTPLPRNSLLPL